MSMAIETVIADHPPNDGRDWDCQCARCGSSLMTEHCGQCEDGYSDHDCGDDTCCCLYPVLNVPCDLCDGRGFWNVCLSSYEWCQANPLPGREQVPRSKPEWYVVTDV